MKTAFQCATCGATVMRQPSGVVGRVFCSRACTHAANKGQPSPNKGKTGKDATGWRGGSIINGGYRYLWMPGHPMASATSNYVAEHRLVVAEQLGRMLLPDEHVHHRNLDQLDNRPENLVALLRPEHARTHRGYERQLFPWSRKSRSCLSCGTSEERHYAHGLCLNCYQRDYMKSKRAEGYIAPSRRKR